jgi:glycosyltransferase involved in cell wall biosynthesis
MMIRTVVHYVDSNIYGGCEEVVLLLLSGFDKTRWRPILVHHEAPGIERLLNEVRQLGISCRGVPAITGHNRLATLRRLVGELRAAEPAIFHAHLNWPLGCRYGVASAKISGVPAIVVTSHLYSPIAGTRFGWLKNRIQAAMIDRYIAVSRAEKERLCRDLGIPDVKVRVVHNGIRLAQFKKSANAALRDKLTEGRDLPLVCTPARLHPQKGHKYLLQAATLVLDAIFVLAGDGPERSNLEELCLNLGLKGRVRFLSHQEDIPQLLATCDLFVLPSLYEGLPLSVLEAMASGKPVVATRVGGTDEVVVHGSTGMLVPPMNVTALAVSIGAMLTDRTMAARFGEAGRKRVAQMFSAEAMVRGVSEVYDELLARTA